MKQNSAKQDRQKEWGRFYGALYPALEENREKLEAEALAYRARRNSGDFMEPVIYVTSRVKSPVSTVEKCRRKKLDISQLNDLVGLRIVCAFTSDVYEAAAWVRSRFEVLEEKDFYYDPKPNGYRSLHLIVRTGFEGAEPVNAEIQIRTIASDFWAALEHQIKYKQDIPDGDILVPELKDAAAQIEAVEIKLNTIKNLIQKAPATV